MQCVQSPPPLPTLTHTHTQTIHSHSLPCQMGIRQLRLERRLRLKTILMLLEMKLHRLDAGLCERQLKMRFTFSFRMQKVTLKDNTGGLKWAINRAPFRIICGVNTSPQPGLNISSRECERDLRAQENPPESIKNLEGTRTAKLPTASTAFFSSHYKKGKLQLQVPMSSNDVRGITVWMCRFVVLVKWSQTQKQQKTKQSRLSINPLIMSTFVCFTCSLNEQVFAAQSNSRPVIVLLLFTWSHQSSKFVTVRVLQSIHYTSGFNIKAAEATAILQEAQATVQESKKENNQREQSIL